MVDPTMRATTILAHLGLEGCLTGNRIFWVNAGIDLNFTEPSALFTSEGTPILVPAVSEPDVDLIWSIRRRLCLVPIGAVVDDISGHQTYVAIRAGATSVLNLRLPWDRQVEALRAVWADRPPEVGSVTGSCSARPRGGQGGPSFRADAQDQETQALIHLLCGSNSISTIARQFYCSERSMYRRIRRLYESAGVSGRSELRSRMAGRTRPALSLAPGLLNRTS
ncbi:hypothetical protein Q5530_07150 [Saccharothrix sp. BKS2]|uniref:hypothetical protein n=1 Tax=Saccharothrix sp. BKS2 TaxID=3064400 RepID=UPI0039E8BE45